MIASQYNRTRTTIERRKKSVFVLDGTKAKPIFTRSLKFLKPRKIDFEPRHKMKGKSKTGKIQARKQAVKSAALRVSYIIISIYFLVDYFERLSIFKEFVREVKEFERNDDADIGNGEANKSQPTDDRKSYNIFDRFKKNKK